MHIRFFTLTVILSFALLACKSGDKPATDTQSVGEAATPYGTSYVLDLPRSVVKWSASKPTGTNHGIVPISAGSFSMADGQITGGTVEINMSALEVKDLEGDRKETLEGHLKGTTPGKEEDFFNVGTYPTATFTFRPSTPLENDPAGTHLIHGDLRIKDITKPVSFKAKLDSSAGTAIKITSEPFQLDRTEWDIRYKSNKFFDNLKDDFIDDLFTLQIEIGALEKSTQ